MAEQGQVRLDTSTSDGSWMVAVSGRLDVSTSGRLDPEVRALDPGGAAEVRIDLAGLDGFDTAGAWLVHRLRRRLKAAGSEVRITGARPEYDRLIERISGLEDPGSTSPEETFHPLVSLTMNIGRQTLAIAGDARKITAFYGLVVVTLVRVILQPKRIRFTSLVHHMQQAGLNSLPITALLAALIGVVLAFQGSSQLRQFGAEIFTVNLIGISVLREIGVLMTSIIVAGRSGSAFTAQIGTMKVNQEVDAMQTLGLDPIEVLVLPRAVALMLTLPLVVLFADMMGLLGGGIMCLIVLDITPTQYLNQLHAAIGPWTFWVGLIKAPVFAFVIALIGCYEGLQVSGSAESVGRLTTKSVVEGIFLVIVIDAMFSILFEQLGI